MQAAVPEMIPQPDGTLLPNPDATTTDGVTAYPLTYVEYAIAPTAAAAERQLHAPDEVPAKPGRLAQLHHGSGPERARQRAGAAHARPAASGTPGHRPGREDDPDRALRTGHSARVEHAAPLPARHSPSGSPSASAGSTSATGAAGAAATSGALSPGSTTPFGTSTPGPPHRPRAWGPPQRQGTLRAGRLRQVAVDLAGFKRYSVAEPHPARPRRAVPHRPPARAGAPRRRRVVAWSS